MSGTADTTCNKGQARQEEETTGALAYVAHTSTTMPPRCLLEAPLRKWKDRKRNFCSLVELHRLALDVL